MKRILLIASIIGLFMAGTMDLQARHRRNTLPQQGRSGVTFGQYRHAPSRDRYTSYGRYDHHSGRQARSGIFFGLSLRAPLLDRYNGYGRYPGRHVASEIRKNEKRIWKLEKRMEKLYRHGGYYGEIRELEQEINYLQRRNDLLRRRLY